jgi:hypothetical protein
MYTQYYNARIYTLLRVVSIVTTYTLEDQRRSVYIQNMAHKVQGQT